MPAASRRPLKSWLAALAAALTSVALLLNGPPAAAVSATTTVHTAAAARECLFMAGVSYGPAGQPGSPARGTVDTASYWGNLAPALTGVCTKITYSHFPKADWTNAQAQRDYYNTALSVYANGGVVFAHGVANNALAAACDQQALCAARWYALSPMLRGTSVATSAAGLGSTLSGSQAVIPYSDSTPRSVAPSSIQTKFPVLSRTVYDKGLFRGVACGTDPFGSGGATGLLLLGNATAFIGLQRATKWWAGIAYAWEPILSDGMNPFDACSLYRSGPSQTGNLCDFRANTTLPCFKPAANFWELTGSAGNRAGILDWIRNMARRG